MMQTLPIGYMLEQKYRVIKVLGQGAFGATYLVDHVHFQTKHVIKEYLPDSAIRNQSNTIIPKSQGDVDNFTWGLRRFFDEAKLLYRLNHPNIVKVTDLFEAHGTAYFVMPYLGSHTFHDWIEQHRNPTEQELLAIFIPLLEGLKYIHSQGLLHRDIKPENILITSDNIPIFIDFGSARNAIGKKSKLLTRVLTPHFAPIEQYSQNAEFSVALDLYSLASSMYQAILGDYPPIATDRVLNDTIIKLQSNTSYNHRYSQYFLQAIDVNLNIYAKDRHQSANDMQNLLLGFNNPTSESTVQEQKPITLNDEELIAWDESSRIDSIASYQHYLSLYPIGKFAQQAREIIQQKKQEAEYEMWEQVTQEDNFDSYNRYLSVYPHSSFSEQARQRLKYLDRYQQKHEQETQQSQVHGQEISPKKRWTTIAIIVSVVLLACISLSYYTYKKELNIYYDDYLMLSLDLKYAYKDNTWQYTFLENPDILDNQDYVSENIIQCEDVKSLDELKMESPYSVISYKDDFKIEQNSLYFGESLQKQFNSLKATPSSLDRSSPTLEEYQQKFGGYLGYLTSPSTLRDINDEYSQSIEALKSKLNNQYLAQANIVEYIAPKIVDTETFEAGAVFAEINVFDIKTRTCYLDFLTSYSSDDVTKVHMYYTESINQEDLVGDLMKNLKKDFEQIAHYKPLK